MNARAAWRLESLGFHNVYRYGPGKADWKAAGLPTEGTGAKTLRAQHAVLRDPPVCGLSDTVGEARRRARAAAVNLCVVVNLERVVLGRVNAEALSRDEGLAVAEVMWDGPATI